MIVKVCILEEFEQGTIMPLTVLQVQFIKLQVYKM